MITLEMLGALMVLAGVVYMAWSAIHRGRMSDPAAGPSDGCASDVGRLAPAPCRNAVEDRLVALDVGAQRLGVVGLDVARRDCMAVDPLRRPLAGQ